MPTSFDPDTAVSGGLLGATGPVQVTLGPCSIDYFDYVDKAGTVVAKTVAALISMSPEGEVDEAGNPKSYQQVYSVGDPKNHHPNPDKASFEGPLVKGSNFNFFIENLLNAGFPKHLIAPGNIKVLNGVVAVVEQKAPPKRTIQGKETDTANKAQVVAVKIIHPAPGEDWPANGKAVVAPVAAGAKKGPAKKAQAPAQPAAPAAAAPAAAAAPVAAAATAMAGPAVDAQASTLAEAVVADIVAAAGGDGYLAKDGQGSLQAIGKKVTVEYMRKMQKQPQQFPANLRAAVVKVVQDEAWLAAGERPWVYDPESGLLVGG